MQFEEAESGPSQEHITEDQAQDFNPLEDVHQQELREARRLSSLYTEDLFSKINGIQNLREQDFQKDIV